MSTEATTGTEESTDMTVEELRAHTLLLAGQLPGTLRRITLRAGALSVDVEWENAPVQAAPVAQSAPTAAPASPEPDTAPANLVRVTAPLVGTYYQAPSPGAEPFVKVGDTVEAGQQLAVIEAMKLLNSITAEVKGVVHAIHVQDGEVVEYAQPLVDLVPAG
ncbi:acetyl-CoA carboxylase biotin carboxyl carrier protein [Streptomyces cylindrosporus]|uniref:Biotin carboxyl carrier protein of acetyl-CoA carboxylase n=1 Tax=Streptomyces cylindrosporus TaxID=2927583 RepID=A0ABS9YEL2_9ACTN|nr:biotin/lipoyl-containing protein [Streptomyces cylindrosporus]MCI3275672.1 acetyl-CoA carboxylase biotin carboxyl carrier protein subunit [Streptomyces cylindrosporus]